jgi:L-ribulose-5-phosphate 4-epimerase
MRPAQSEVTPTLDSETNGPERVVSDEGGSTFSYRWNGTAPLPESDWRALGEWRQKLASLHVLGVSASGVAFGNLSQRRSGTQRFVTTGTRTAGVPVLDERHFAEVLGFDLDCHALTCRGPVLPSSEALSHAAVYQSDSNLSACLHVHHARLWHALLGRGPTTSSDGGCGSLKMAHDILRLFAEARDRAPRIIVMAGHADGLLFMGASLDEAGLRLVEELRRL